MLVDQVERQERVAQVVEHPQEQDEVEALAELAHVVDRKLAELDLGPLDLGRKPRLGEVVRVGVDRDHPVGAAPLHLQRVEPGVAADVEHAPPTQVGRDRVREALPLDVGVVAQEVLGRGPHPAEVHVVEPGPELVDPAPDQLLLGGRGLVGHRGPGPSRRSGAGPPSCACSSSVAAR